jgi:hypothetical protein
MHSAEIVFIVVSILLVLVIGNIVFSFVAERKNPPIGSFIECEGVRLHFLERGDPVGPSVVLFHGNGSLIQISSSAGLTTVLLATTEFYASIGQALDTVNGLARAHGPRHHRRRCS